MAEVDAARESQEQRESEIGHRFIKQAGRVGDDDPLPRRGGNVNGIVTNAPAGDHFQTGRRGRVQDRFGEFVRAGEHGVLAFEQRQQDLLAQRAEAGRNDGIASGAAQQLLGGRTDLVEGPRGDQDFPGHAAQCSDPAPWRKRGVTLLHGKN